MILKRFCARKISRDFSDVIARAVALPSMNAIAHSVKSHASAFQSEASREILRPKEGLQDDSTFLSFRSFSKCRASGYFAVDPDIDCTSFSTAGTIISNSSPCGFFICSSCAIC